MHNHLDQSVLGEGPVAYELWCPGGLTEPAAKVLDTWPEGWTAQAVAEDAVEVIGAYSAFKGIDWDAIGEETVTKFQGVVRPSYCDGIIISALVRKRHPIYEAFFQGKVSVIMRFEGRLIAKIEGRSASGAAGRWTRRVLQTT